jgi:hypothetical protein
MARLNIGVGAAANDGTGDTLRTTGTKINTNFEELYNHLGGDPDAIVSKISFTENTIVHDSAYNTVLAFETASADRTITFPNATDTLVGKATTDTLTNKTLTSPLLTDPVLTPAATTAGKILFKEGTDNGTNAVTLIGPASTADITLTLPATADTLVGKATTDTLTNKTLTSPRIGTAIFDTGGAELIKLTATGSAVNEITIANAASGAGPTVSATGETNVNLNLDAKGTGSVEINKLAITSEIIDVAGPVTASTAAGYIIGNRTGGTMSVTLADGTTVGETKIFTNRVSGIMTVTPLSFASGSTFALAEHDGCTVIWDGFDWYLIGNKGEITIA